jgi:hypothetical protein
MSEPCYFHKKPLIVFELNEFNEDLLETAAKQYDLKNILALLSYPKTKINPLMAKASTLTSPSERWESLHTGVALSTHGISRLGTQYGPPRPSPYWENLLDKEHTVGLWGVMNAKKPRKSPLKFFLPDLWQLKEHASPKSLNNFISLPRYITKNYPGFSPNILFKDGFKFISFIKNSGFGKKIILELIKLLSQLIHSTSRTLLFVCFYDLISCMVFSEQLKKNPVHLSIFFANSLAYLQHYYWRQGKWVTTAPLLHGLKIIDKMIGMLRQFEHTHHIILINGLTQENRQYQPEHIIYKIKEPTQFFRYMALSPTAVDALCPDNGIVYFNSTDDCETAITLLNKASIGKNAIFSATRVDHHSRALHYKIILKAATNKEDFFELNDTEFRFFKYFKAINTLTGCHNAQGALYSRGVEFPKEIAPELFSQYILNYYADKPAEDIPKPLQAV